MAGELYSGNDLVVLVGANAMTDVVSVSELPRERAVIEYPTLDAGVQVRLGTVSVRTFTITAYDDGAGTPETAIQDLLDALEDNTTQAITVRPSGTAAGRIELNIAGRVSNVTRGGYEMNSPNTITFTVVASDASVTEAAQGV